MVFDSERFDLQPYTGFDMSRYVRRTSCGWEDSGWKSLLVQRFEHVPVVEDLRLPAVADLQLILPLSGRAVMETRGEGRWIRHQWGPGRLELAVPGKPVPRRYRGDESMRSLQVHIPDPTVEAVAARLGGRAWTTKRWRRPWPGEIRCSTNWCGRSGTRGRTTTSTPNP
ncbi:MAG TPA: hypothetical protein VFG15_08255 [Amycolatopsis sp.]|nr:hypothetical protein [Amycolatopsis sp.]